MNSVQASISAQREPEPTAAQAARINKWLAMWAFNHGFASEATTAERFRVHPEWAGV
jgi:hypothetical protein